MNVTTRPSALRVAAILVVAGAIVAACSSPPPASTDYPPITPPTYDASAPPPPASDDAGAPGEGGEAMVDGSAATDAGADARGDAAHVPEGGADAGDAMSAGDGGCAPGTVDCDHDPANGCETKLDDDPKNCGACGHDCTALPHVSGAVSCTAGACVVPPASCQHGYAHCSAKPEDGCETDLSQPSSCGACTTSCTGASPVCSPDGSGGFACSSGCPASAPTRCGSACVDTATDPNDCGGCGHACAPPAHATATCATSACGFACNAGYHACGGACDDDTSPGSCGTSCTPCAAPANGTATCDGKQCGIACNAGYHACSGACADDTSVQTCGGSCAPCPVPMNATATCDGKACGFTCNAGYADCDGNAANGCEVFIRADAANCGACGHACTVANVGGTCIETQCQSIELLAASTVQSKTYAPIALTPNAIAWAAANEVLLFRTNAVTGAPISIQGTAGTDEITSLATDGTSVYYVIGATTASGGTPSYAIGKVAADGSSQSPLVTGLASWENVALVGSTLYATAYSKIATMTTTGQNLQFGANCDAHGNNCRFKTAGPVAADASGAFFSSDNGILSWLPGVTIPYTTTNTTALALDASYVYWNDGGVVRAPRNGSGSAVRVIGVPEGHGFAIHDGHAYVASANTIVRVPVGGATAQDPVTTIAYARPTTATILDVAVDDTAVYFTTDQPALWGVAK